MFYNLNFVRDNNYIILLNGSVLLRFVLFCFFSYCYLQITKYIVHINASRAAIFRIIRSNLHNIT